MYTEGYLHQQISSITVHLHEESNKINIMGWVRQGDPMSPKRVYGSIRKHIPAADCWRNQKLLSLQPFMYQVLANPFSSNFVSCNHCNFNIVTSRLGRYAPRTLTCWKFHDASHICREKNMFMCYFWNNLPVAMRATNSLSSFALYPNIIMMTFVLTTSVFKNIGGRKNLRIQKYLYPHIVSITLHDAVIMVQGTLIWWPF